MAVYYKFKSAKDYDSIAMDGPFISVGTLKEKIFESKHLGRGTDFDLLVTNAQSNEEYLDEAMLIPKNTSVLIRRVPGRPRMPIVTDPNPKVEEKVENIEPERTSFPMTDSTAMKYPDELEWDDLGGDLYEIPDAPQYQPINVISEAPPANNNVDEDSKIKALIDTPALDWQRQGSDGFGQGRGFGRGMGGRMMGGRGFGGMERKTPPQGYICHRCKTAGHFIQHCPTNGDPKFDIKRVKPPTGIPKSMLMATPDGSYALPSGAVAVLRPNEAAFEREIEGLPSTRSVGDLPPELHCPLCKEVMKDAVLTSKCCFKSFCDKCIRDHIISRSICVCGATNVLADDLLPNKTLRDTISRILESGNSSENAGSAFHVQDMESARCSQPKIPSPTMSAASKGEGTSLSRDEETPKVGETAAAEMKPVIVTEQQVEKRMIKIPDVSEATRDSISVKEPASQGSAPLVDEEVQQKLASGEAAKKKKKKKLRPATDLQWKAPPDLPVDNYMMPPMGMGGPSVYNNNPFWGGMQQPMLPNNMDGFMAPFAPPIPYNAQGFMGYGMGQLEMPFGGGFMPPHDPYNAQGFMFPNMQPPQRDFSEFNMGMNNMQPPPAMSREQFEAHKADLRRKRDMERRGGESREFPRERDFSREVSSSGDGPMMKPKSKPIDRPPSPDHHRRHRPERSTTERPMRDIDPPRPPKRKADHHHDHDRDNNHHHNSNHHHRHRTESSGRHAPESSGKSLAPTAATISESAAERAHKASVFSRISFPEGEAKKKRKVSSPSEVPAGSGASKHDYNNHQQQQSQTNGYYEDHKTTTTTTTNSSLSTRKSRAVEYDSSDDDDDRHFKRKPSRYEPSPPPPPLVDTAEPRHSRGSRHR